MRGSLHTIGVSLLCVGSAILSFNAPMRGVHGAEASRGLDWENWRYRASIEPAEEDPGEGVVEFKVAPEVYDRARRDLADLRVLAGNRILPWVTERRRGTQRSVQLETALYNPTYRPGEFNRVVVDFGERIMKDSIRVDTPGRDFKRRIRVEAGRDGETWEILQDDSFLFDVSAGPDGRYRRDRVSLPGNDFRYLRITVYHDPDDPKEVPIEGVHAWRREGQPAPLVRAPVVESTVAQDREDNVTLITLDLGYRNLPLNRLRLDFEEADFHRYVTLWGRNATTREVVRRMEGGGERKVTVGQPWRRITDGHIHRYSAGQGYSSSLDIQAGPYRYLQVRIHNGDDPPLTFVEAEADRFIDTIVFPPRRPGPYWLFFGNPEGEKPDYDLQRYVGRLRSEGVTGAETGDVVPLRLEALEEIPFSELYRWVLWIALLGAVGLVGWMVWRQAAGASRHD